MAERAGQPAARLDSAFILHPSEYYFEAGCACSEARGNRSAGLGFPEGWNREPERGVGAVPGQAADAGGLPWAGRRADGSAGLYPDQCAG
ncbi:hypothetical protein D3C81_2024620 [compost metagenome]